MDTFKISNSKLSTFWGCEQRYVWNYLEKLVPRTVDAPLKIGAAYHNGVATILHPTNKVMRPTDRLALAERTLERYCTENNMLDQLGTVMKYVQVYNSNIQPFMDSFNMLSVEQWNETEVFTINGVKIYAISKSDGIATANGTGRIWVIEHKTAASMGPKKEIQFTDGAQIAQYSYVLRDLLRAPIYGVKFHFLVKTKAPKFYECTGLIDDRKLERWYDTAKNSVERMLQLEDGATAIQNLSSCNGPFYECKYKPLCNHGLNSATKNMFTEKTELKPTEGGILA